MNPTAATPPRVSPSLQAVPVPNAEYHDPDVLYPGESNVLLAGAPWHRFAVLGDSIAEGLGEPTLGYTTSPWADRVANALESAAGPIEYLNLGERHLIAEQVLESQLERALAFAPDLAGVIAGGNNVLGEHFDPDAALYPLDEIFASLRGAGVSVFTFTLLDPSPLIGDAEWLGERIADLNAGVRELAARHGVAVTDLANHPYASDRSIFSSDMLHANMRGHAIIASATIERLGELVRNHEGAL